jgi:hypothetical protein
MQACTAAAARLPAHGVLLLYSPRHMHPVHHMQPQYWYIHVLPKYRKASVLHHLQGSTSSKTSSTAVWCLQVFKATFMDPNIPDEQLQVRPLRCVVVEFN